MATLPRVMDIAGKLRKNASTMDFFTAGSRFAYPTGQRDLPKKFLQAVTDQGGAINPREKAGVIEEYLAANSLDTNIIEEAIRRARAQEAQGKLPKGTASKIATYNNIDAPKTAETINQLQDYVDSSLPKSVPQFSTEPTTRRGHAMDLSLLGEDPTGMLLPYEGTLPRSQLLPVPRNFDFEKFARRTTPETISKMNRLATAGADVGSRWYNTLPLLRLFEENFPPSEVGPRFRKFMAIQAAASPRSSPLEQVLRGSMEHFRSTQGLPPMTQKEMQAFGTGHLAHDIQTKQFEKIRAGEPLTKTTEVPKIGSYNQNFLGNWGPATVDTHHFVAGNQFEYVPDIDKKTGLWIPRVLPDGDITLKAHPETFDETYTPMEILTTRMAQRHGWWPAQEQAAVWSGINNRMDLYDKVRGVRNSGEFLTIMDSLFPNSARLAGVPLTRHVEDVLKGNAFLRKRKDGGPVGPLRALDGDMGGAQHLRRHQSGGRVNDKPQPQPPGALQVLEDLDALMKLPPPAPLPLIDPKRLRKGRIAPAGTAIR